MTYIDIVKGCSWPNTEYKKQVIEQNVAVDP